MEEVIKARREILEVIRARRRCGGEAEAGASADSPRDQCEKKVSRGGGGESKGKGKGMTSMGKEGNKKGTRKANGKLSAIDESMQKGDKLRRKLGLSKCALVEGM